MNNDFAFFKDLEIDCSFYDKKHPFQLGIIWFHVENLAVVSERVS